MPKFESELGSKKFVGQPMREVDIPDASGYTSPAPRNSGQDHSFHMDEGAMRDFESRVSAPPPSMQRMSMPTPEEQVEIERQYQAARDAKKSGKERMSDGAKRRIEMLVGMTRLTKTIDIDGTTYVLQTLKSKELRESIVAAAEFDGTVEFSFETAKQLLGRSLVQLAGVDIEQFLNSNELSVKLVFIEDLDQALLMRLYNEYVSLSNEAQEKYSIKTPEQAKEVIEELKK
jgi:hypothetical protein